MATGGHKKYIMLTLFHGIKNDLANVKTLKDDPRSPFEVRLKGQDFTTPDSKVIAAATISRSALTAARYRQYPRCKVIHQQCALACVRLDSAARCQVTWHCVAEKATSAPPLC